MNTAICTRHGGPVWFIALVATLTLTMPAARAAADHVVPGLLKAGEGRLSFFGISLYTASLWASSATGVPNPQTEHVLLSIRYERNIPRARLLSVTRKEWRRLSIGTPQQREHWLQQLAAVLPDIRRGDRLSSLSVPGEATRFFSAGREIGRVADPDFGAAFLAIWLDPRTRARQLRASMLTRQRLAQNQTYGTDHENPSQSRYTGR